MAPWKRLWPLVLVVASVRVSGSEEYPPSTKDIAPVDWASFERLWIKGFPRATNSEPLLGAFDESRAIAFLDDVSLRWTRQNRCGTCHTNVPYLMVRPLLPGGDVSALQEIRSTVKTYAAEQLAKPTDRTNFRVAALASALAVYDANSGHALGDPDVRNMFDFLWTTQEQDGSWHYYLADKLPFLERNNYYVALLVALGLGYAPHQFLEAPTERAGFAKLQSFLRRNIPENMHERAVLLWASVRTPGLLLPAEQARIQNHLIALQNADGGWTLPALGRWPRHDGPPNDPRGPSDGYATGLATFVLCESGYTVENSSIRKAIDWIQTHQRVSGRWFTSSTYSDQFKNYLSNMGTAYSLLALKSCNASAASVEPVPTSIDVPPLAMGSAPLNRRSRRP